MPTTWGARIPARCLGALYSPQVSKGTAVTAANPTGARFTVTNDSGMIALRGLGSAEPILFKPGESQGNFELTIPQVQNLDFIKAVCARTNGELPWFTLGFGVKFDGATPTQWGWQIQDCKIHSGRFRLGAKGGLECTLSGVGGLITELTAFTPANPTDAPFMGYEAVLTRGGAAFEALEWSEEFGHNVVVDWVLHGAAPTDFTRGWSYQTEGNADISGQFQLLQKTGIDYHAETMDPFATVLTITSKDDPTNKAIVTYTDMVFNSEAFAGADEGATFTAPYQAKSRTIADA